VTARTEDGLSLRILTLIDEYTRSVGFLKQPVDYEHRMYWSSSVTCLFIGDCQDSFTRIMGQSLQRKLSGTG